MSKRKESTSNPPPTKKIKPDNHQNSQFYVLKSSLILSVPPIFAADPKAGAHEMLDSMLMRQAKYIPSLQGVFLSHSNITFKNPTAKIQADCPFLVLDVIFDAVVWSPKIGHRLEGRINLCSPDHIAFLVHKTFNVSIPHHHIPTETWEYSHGPAENDPEFGSKDDDTRNGGNWIHKVTGEPLGGTSGSLEFTVIGLTVANEMLSLLGSIQPDPFSSRHAPASNTIPEDVDLETETDDEKTGSSSSSDSDGDVAV